MAHRNSTGFPSFPRGLLYDRSVSSPGTAELENSRKAHFWSEVLSEGILGGVEKQDDRNDVTNVIG